MTEYTTDDTAEKAPDEGAPGQEATGEKATAAADATAADAIAADATAADATSTDATACAYTSYETREEIPYDEKTAAEGEVPRTGAGAEGVEARVWDALYDVEDPEMPISIVDLGLLYGVDVTDGVATVEMTLTYTGCPARDMLLAEVREAVADVDGVESVDLTLVWSPNWTVDMVTEAGKDSLREFGLSV